MQQRTKNGRWNRALLALIFGQILLLLTAYFGRNSEARSIYLLLLFSGVVLFLSQIYVIVHMFSNTYRNVHMEVEMETLEKKRVLEKNQQKIQAEHSEEAEALQMETKTALKQMQEHLTQKQYMLSQDLLEKFTKDFSERKYTSICNDGLLDALFETKKMIAQEKGIAISYHIILPGKLSIHQTDLCSIFFNLLDNAIESCTNADTDHPFIDLDVVRTGEYLSIHMKNSKNKAVSFSYKTTKKEKNLHGFGLSIMEAVVQKYDGSCEWLDQTDYFESILMLRDRKPDAE